jgi:DNA processing protein
MINLSDDEKTIVKAFGDKTEMHIDELCYAAQMPMSKMASLLLQMEFSNLVKCKPGKMYAIS